MGGPFYPNEESQRAANLKQLQLARRKAMKQLQLARRRAANAAAWAIGEQQPNGFHVRKVVWGMLMAKSECREGEEIRAATILVGPKR